MTVRVPGSGGQVGQLGGQPARGRGPVDHRWVRGRQPQSTGQPLVPVHVEGPDERGQPESSLVARGIHRIQVAATRLDDLQLDRLDRLRAPPRAAGPAIRPVPRTSPSPTTWNRSSSWFSPALAPSSSSRTRSQPDGRREIEQPDQQRHRATDLVGLRCDRQRLVQLVGMIGDHLDASPTRLSAGGSMPPEAGVVRPQLGCPAGQHQPEDPGQQAQLDHRTGRGVLVAAHHPQRSALRSPGRRPSRAARTRTGGSASPAWARNRWASVSPRSKPTITLRPSEHLSTLPSDSAGPRLQ